MDKIETTRMIIREFTPEDAGDLHEILGDEETMKLCEPAYSYEKTQKFLEDFCIGRKGALAAAQKKSGKVIGYILFKSIEEDVYEMGWFFNRKYWRQGYAYEACVKIMEYAFDVMHVHKIIAETIDTERSVKLMEKLGMTCEGIQRNQVRDNTGNRADLHLYGILREDRITGKLHRQDRLCQKLKD